MHNLVSIVSRTHKVVHDHRTRLAKSCHHTVSNALPSSNWATGPADCCQLCYFLWKFRTQVTQGQVTRSRQVTPPHHRKTLNVRHSYTEWPITLKLSAIDIRTSIYETISEFWYRWPKVRSILRPLHYKSMGENERRLFCTKTIQNTLKHRITGRIDFLSRNIVTGDPSSSRQGHFRSCKVTSSFSAITFDRDQLERWKHHRCVEGDDADRLTCNMTFLGQVMTLTWGQIFNMTFQGQLIVHSTRLDERNTMLVK